MARPEPFRTLLEEARVSEPSSVPVTTTSPRSSSGPSARVMMPAVDAKAMSPTSASAPAASAEEARLAKKLDQALLAGVTPPRGMRTPFAAAAAASGVPLPRTPSIPLRLEPLPPPPSPVVLATPAVRNEGRSEATSSLLDEIEAFNADATRQLDRPAAIIDAAMRDSVAAAEATREIPAQRRVPARPVTITGITPPPQQSDATTTMSNAAARTTQTASVAVAAPVPMPLPVDDENNIVTVPKLALMPEVAEQQRKRPPPLPRRTPSKGVAAPVPVAATSAPKPIVVPLDDDDDVATPFKNTPRKVPTASLAPVLSAPAPKIMQVLGDESTIPGLSPASSGSGKVISQADLYRLQLEFEDTPARPLPALASLLPLPVLAPTLAPESPVAPAVAAPVLVDDERLAGVESTDLNRLEELEGIEDLDALAQAMGLRSYHEISIPDGEPVGDGDSEIGDDDIVDEQPRMTSDVRRARVRAALGDGREDVFLDDEKTIEGLPAIVSRPPLPSRPAKPVVVKIPARPKVSLEARNQARKLYLAAVDELAKGDKVGAIGHLKLAIHYDDGIPLYQDFLKQLTKGGDPGATSPRRRRMDASSVRG